MSSSRFVSAGTPDQPNDKEDDAWKRAQEAIEASKQRTEASNNIGSGLQEGGKSLYEVLQANKIAKQEAFEESLRLKNQVQFLNEEDAEYLESLSKIERAQKAASEKEAREQLAAFRKQQDDAEKAAIASGQSGVAQQEEESWSNNARKRKKAKEHDLIKGVKLRKTSSSDKAEAGAAKISIEELRHDNKVGQDIGGENQGETGQTKASSPVKVIPEPQAKPASPVAALGLAAYSSDEDD